MSLLLAMGVLSAFGTPIAKASPSLKAVSAARAIPAQAPISEICSAQGSKSLCANRNAGGTSAGTYVIGWSAGDPNNDFAFGYLTGMCNHGRVSASLECPFTANKGLNAYYNGKAIVDIFNWETPFCIADSGTGSGATVLDKCPDTNGDGGADGTIFILSDVTQTVGKPPTTYVVNRYWSNFTGLGGGTGSKPRWLCVIGKGTYLIENNGAGYGGVCQWNEI